MNKRIYGLFLAGALSACGGESPEYAVLVRGELFTQDLTEAQARHDMLAAGGEADARAAGDLAHDVGLGSGLFSSTSSQSFLAVDRWDNLEGLTDFYANPDFAAGFAQLFSGPPIIEQFERQHDFHSWGDLDSAEGTSRFVVVVRGRLAAATPEARQEAHDAAAIAGEEMVKAAGDVAHVAYLGLADPAEFLAFDVWNNGDNLMAVYSDPDFQASFTTLFATPPSLQIYRGSDWHQW